MSKRHLGGTQHDTRNIMRTISGPALFLAQFISDTAPFNTLDGLAGWAASLGFVGLQVPTTNPAIFDLARAAHSDAYCDEVHGILADKGLALVDLSTHLQGQLVAVHPAYSELFDAFAPEAVRGRPAARQAWAEDQLRLAAIASRRLGLATHATFSGSLAWPYLYPWPQRPEGLVDEAFAELARRWRPLLDEFDRAGCAVCFELHPSEDLHDGVTFERFLDGVGNHPACCILYDPSHFLLQQMDYVGFIDVYIARIRSMHVKDAEFRPSARQGLYGGYSAWRDRAARFRSVGDGQVDFKAIFAALATGGYDGWAVLEWECALKDSMTGAREGAAFIRNAIIPVSATPFDDFARAEINQEQIRRLLLGPS